MATIAVLGILGSTASFLILDAVDDYTDASLTVLRSFVAQFPERLAVRVQLTRAMLDQGRSADALDEVSNLITRLGDASALLERESVE